MDAEIPSGKLEYGGASLGYLSFRQNVWTCCSLRASCPEYCRAGKCSVTQVVPGQMECVASCRSGVVIHHGREPYRRRRHQLLTEKVLCGGAENDRALVLLKGGTRLIFYFRHG